MKLDDLILQARDYADRFHEAGLHPRLIGGLAVHLMAEEYRANAEAELGFEVSLLPIVDPRRLACLPRVTEDVDIVVPAPEGARAEGVLEAAGLSRTPIQPPPLRFTDHGKRVDLIEFDEEDGATGTAARDLGASLSSLQDAFAQQPDPRTHLLHASSAALVVLKGVAYRSRWEKRDLRDVARIALVDVAVGTVRKELRKLWPTLPRALKNDVRALLEVFSGPDATGPSAFVDGIIDQEPELATSEALQDDVRREIAASVNALLDWTSVDAR